MNFPIVNEYRSDIKHIDPDNQVRGEPFSIAPGIWTRIVVPLQSPFFVKSLKIYNANMEPLTLAKGDAPGDYRIYKIMSGLTDLTAQSVACMIEFTNLDITSGFMDYDVVGEFSLFDSTFLKLVLELQDDDRPAWWEYITNKPKYFRPKLHGHSILYDMVALMDMVEIVDGLMNYLKANERTALVVKFDHYLDLLTNYIRVYKTEILGSLNRHKNAYDAHGFTKLQAGLPLVDNFATATGDNLYKPRSDMHLTVPGMRSIIEANGFNSAELLEAGSLAISQFGNTNFIPANIDGSFEGLGGIYEAAAIAMETDGTVTYLSNRMDGRVRGLYYSVMTNVGSNPKLTYTGYRYTHPKFAPDGATVDRVAQGSGGEVILVGDGTNQIYYIGMTNGSLDPARHVYSKIDLSPLVNAIYSQGGPVSELFRNINIALIGPWIYLFLGASVGDPVPAPSQLISLRYKHIFRVAVSDVQATVNVTPVRQYVSYQDADGVQRNNYPYFLWHDEVKDGDGNFLRALFNFQQPLNPFAYLGITSVMTLAAQDPNRPGIYALKFFGGYFASYFSANFNGSFDYAPEITYEFNPNNNVMSITSKSNLPFVNFAANPVINGPYAQNQALIDFVRHFEGQGLAVLDNGRIFSSAAAGAFGYPREAGILTAPGSGTRYSTISRLWGTAAGWPYTGLFKDEVVMPLASGSNVRCVLYNPGCEFYVAAKPESPNDLQLYYRPVSGGYAIRPGVNNLVIPNMYSRPLTSDVRKVNAPFALGGMTVSAPGGVIGNYGVEIGHSAFCMGVQKKYFNRDIQGSWPGGVGADDIVMIANHSNIGVADGTVNIVPGVEILYPAWIVETLKAQVANPAIKDRGRFCSVTICDPTFSSGAFGWLPITVAITYCDTYGLPNTDTVYTTFMTINASYVAQGNRQVVTGVSVIDILHNEKGSAAYKGAMPAVYGSDPNNEGSQTSLGSMRTYYYLNGNSLQVYFCTGIRTPGVFDYLMGNVRFSYDNRDTRRWSSAAYEDDGSLLGCMSVTPDNGIARAYQWKSSSGGAATIIDGPAYKALLGSSYPAIGWLVYFKTAVNVTFNGKAYVLPAGAMDLRSTNPSPGNRTFYIYAILRNGSPTYEIAEDKRLETPFQIWVGRVITNATQIVTVERFNVVTLNGNRVSETKRGNCIPASSGLANAEGQLPWIRNDELLP